DLLDLLRSPLMNVEALEMSPKDVSVLDRQSYEARLVGGLEPWRKFLQKTDFASFAPQILALVSAIEGLNAAQTTSKSHARSTEDLLDKYMKLPGSEANIRSAQAVTERE